MNHSLVNDVLEKRFTEAEVWALIKECDRNKTPGSDGFNMLCVQKGWKVIKNDIMKFMKEFHDNSRLGYGMNCSLVTLIPKNDNPSSIGDYRPVSLINSVYKILSKVLASRFKQVLPAVIDKAQSVFLSGTNIIDGVLIANEVVDWC